jgi:hypothetical protein
MHRRGFLAALLPVVALTAAAKPKEDLPDEVQLLNGWTARWTGWKPRSDGIEIVGQWIARDMDYPHSFGFYASCPGKASKFRQFECFDLSVSWKDYSDGVIVIPDIDTKKDVLDRLRRETFGRLLQCMRDPGVQI